MKKRINTIDDFLGLLRGVRTVGEGRWQALCPGHNDHKPSLSISLNEGNILIKCFAGCAPENILAPLSLKPSDLFLNGQRAGNRKTQNVPAGEGCYRITDHQDQTQESVTSSQTIAPITGITLQALADAKGLPIDFLKQLGLGDYKNNGYPAVRIPYLNDLGEVQAIRLRHSVSGDHRFTWKKGNHAMPYGINRLDEARKKGWILIVEGESDCWTGWYYNLPFLGIPGKSLWKPAWANYFEGIDKIFVWQEPDAEDFTLRILDSVPNLHVIQAPADIKDISDAHIRKIHIPEFLDSLKYEAKPGKELKERLIKTGLRDYYNRASYILEADDPLKLIEDAIVSLGYGGDTKPALVTYLAATSRLLVMRDGAMPVHLLISGPSSAGKSYTLSVIKKLLPSEAYHEIEAGSPRVLIYDETSLEHKVLIFGEADSLPAGEDNPAASAIRNLLQEHWLHYSVTVRDPESGDYVVRDVNKPGPTVLITTSTRSPGEQLGTRLFTLEVADSQEQIAAALKTQAVIETEGAKPQDDRLPAFQSYLQIQAPIKVFVPFAGKLADLMAKMASAPRLLRDFQRLLSLVKATAVIRQYNRKTDSEGRIIADVADYETVYNLVNEIYIDSVSGAVANVRAIVDAVSELERGRNSEERITAAKLGSYLDISKMAALRRARKALKNGWIVNKEQRKGYPADYTIGDPMPSINGLPTIEDLTTKVVNNSLSPDSTVKTANGNTVTGSTDSNNQSLLNNGVPPYPSHSCPNCDSEWVMSPEGQYVCENCGFLHPQECTLYQKGDAR